MSIKYLSCYIQASSSQPGALGIFLVYGCEEVLAARIDAAVGVRNDQNNFNTLCENELRYGWLRADDGRLVDEVMLAKPAPGVRELMTHGGKAIAEAVRAFLDGAGFTYCDDVRSLVGMPGVFESMPVDPVLAGCVTQTQLAAVLEAREAGMNESDDGLDRLLQYHRVLLAGPPNAGKSSLLNRLAGYDRAFVHERAGATRDVVDELVDLGGYAVILGDLPGYTGSAEGLDHQAWRLAAERLGLAEAILFVCDRSGGWDDATDKAAAAVAAGLQEGIPVLIVQNKSDLPKALVGEPWRRHFPEADSVEVCSLPDGNAREVLDAAVWALFWGDVT